MKRRLLDRDGFAKRRGTPAAWFRRALLEAVGEASLDLSGYCRLAAQAMVCVAKGVEERLTCLKLPASHRRRVQTTNSLERLIEEDRRRTKVLGPLAASA